jgi:hypothetical protein
MSPEPSTTVSSAAHSGVKDNKEYLQEVVGDAVEDMYTRFKVVVPDEFKGYNISFGYRVSNDCHLTCYWSNENSGPEPHGL